MRCAILVVAACALAGALAVPIEKSSDNAVSRKGEVFAEFSDNSLEGQSEEGGLSTKERIRQKIVELRDAIASATSDLAKIIWQQAMDHGGKLSESLAIAREKVVKRLKELKDELLVKIREAMIPDDDVPVTYVIDEIFEQIIDGLKEQISEALKTMSDWHNLLTESGRAKIAEAKKRITELAQKIADTIREWRRAKDSATTTESSNYNSDPFYNDQLMIKLKELLEDLKVQLEINMLQRSGSNIEEEQESMIDFEEVDTQVTESLDSVRKMFEEATGMDVSPYNIIANLRKLLLRRMQELESLIRANADAKTIKMLETEILSLRRRLIEAVQEVFQRSSS